MKNVLVVSAASLLIGVSALVGCKKEETATNDTRTAGEKTRDALATAGDKTADAAGKAVDSTNNAAKSAGTKMENSMQPSANTAVKDSRDTLAKAVDSAISENGFNDVVGTLDKADRDRIGKLDNTSLADLNTATSKFRTDWKGKYGHDFKVTDKREVVFGTPVEIKPGAAAAITSSDSAKPGTIDKSANNIAAVNFPAAGGAPALTVPMVNDGAVMNSYKIDVPDTTDATILRDNLIKHIDKVDGMKDRGLQDENEAYRIASHHILMAITAGK